MLISLPLNAMLDELGECLLKAVREEDFDIIKLLVEKGVDVNYRGSLGQSALHFAAEKSDPKFVRYLLESGADVNARTSGGTTPLHVAQESELVVVHLLLSRGAQVNVQDDEGDSPLHIAAQYGRQDHCKLLLDAGALPLRARDGSTAAALAEREGNTFLAGMLRRRV